MPREPCYLLSRRRQERCREHALKRARPTGEVPDQRALRSSKTNIGTAEVKSKNGSLPRCVPRGAWAPFPGRSGAPDGPPATETTPALPPCSECSWRQYTCVRFAKRRLLKY